MDATESDPIRRAITALPQLLREPASVWFERWQDRHPDSVAPIMADGQRLRQLATLVACSEFAGRQLLRDWDWFLQSLDAGFPAGDKLAVALAQNSQANTAGIMRELRRYRNRSLVRILWRQLIENADLDEALSELSSLADETIRAAVACAEQNLQERFGKPTTGNGDYAGLLVLAMGKLGGNELNFSSDIDLVFLHQAGGDTDGTKAVSANEYFVRLARQVVSLLDEVTEDGFVFRVDTRLRPFGDSGPPVVSFSSLESYLLQHGRSWERYAYIKARVVDMPGVSRAATELQDRIIRPFVFRQYLDYGVFESLRYMKSMIEEEVKRRDLANNIKLGPGGIREIEFIGQSMQLVRGGADLRFRQREIQNVLPLLLRSRTLTHEAVAELSEAYRFLRRLENFLQAIRDKQTHDLPGDARDRARLALAMGAADWDRLDADIERHRGILSRHFTAIAFRDNGDDESKPATESLQMRWQAGGSASEWEQVLRDHGLGQPSELAGLIVDFVAATPEQQMDSEARHRLATFMPRFLGSLKEAHEPGAAFQRVMRIISQVIRRSAYIALLNENPPALHRLTALCERSAYLADTIARYPLLLDELLDPRIYSTSLGRAEMSSELALRLSWGSGQDSERAIETLSQYQRATLFRIAVADISNGLPVMKVSDSLTDLAEVILQEALRLAYRDLVEQYGEPCMVTESGPRQAGFGVVAYGKLAGLELSYRSDLDLVFLHDSRGERQQTNGARQIDNSMFFSRLARRLVHFLTTQTGTGSLYEIDMRLRPSGHSGLIVTSVEAFERYQEENAWTWEHQALLRSRPVAGSAVIARAFERIRAETLRNRVRRDSLREDVLKMRSRMRQELDKSNDELFDLKQGAGGIGDIEFMVQFLALRDANAHPAVIHYPDNIRQLGTLAAAGSLDAGVARQLQLIYQQYRLRQHRLVLDDRQPLVPVTEFVAERRFVTRSWQEVFG
jgi:glutamate-ammonia-ligase adenylyltransferase